jgi:hypothetical protein
MCEEGIEYRFMRLRRPIFKARAVVHRADTTVRLTDVQKKGVLTVQMDIGSSIDRSEGIPAE